MKKILLIIGLVLLIFLTVSAASAAGDVNDTHATNNMTHTLSQGDNVHIETNVNAMQNVKDTTPGTLVDLQNEVNYAVHGSVLDLHRDYTATNGNTVILNKDLTIDGHNHSIDCNRKCNAFYMNGDYKVTMKNLRIINGYNDGNGGAISIPQCKGLTLINCTLNNNEAGGNGGAIYCDVSHGKDILRIEKCTLNNNTAQNKGGAVYSIGSGDTLKVKDSYLEGNVAKSNDGGAIYHVDNRGYREHLPLNSDVIVHGSTFIKNKSIKGDGGAIFVETKNSFLDVDKCNFNGNSATGGNAKRYGGAICTMGILDLTNSTLKNNNADNHGGAVYAERMRTLENVNFEGNTAQNDNGGAIYINKYTPWHYEVVVKNCNFTNNKAINGDGGAFYCDHSQRTIFKNCRLIGNYANGGKEKRYGGAIRVQGSMDLDGCYLKDNWAENHGGAIYTEEMGYIKNTVLENNHVKNGDGGAIYINSYPGYIKSRTLDDTVLVENSTFNNNYAVKGDGGAIHSDSSTTILKIVRSNFDGNIANHGVEKRYGGAINSKGTVMLDSCSFKNNWAENYGGAIYTNKLGYVKNCSFTGNKAKEGGAIYVNSKCDPSIENTYFNGNKATDGRGGAIYMDSKFAKLTLVNDAFINNYASGQGKDIFHSGKYGTIKNNWWGDNNPSFDNEKLMEYRTFGSNVKHEDANPNIVTASRINEGGNTGIKLNFKYAVPKILANDVVISVNGKNLDTTKTVIGNTIELKINEKIAENAAINVALNSFKAKV